MKKQGIDLFRNAVDEEIKRIKRIQELQQEKLVIEYLKLTRMSPLEVNTTIEEIIKDVLFVNLDNLDINDYSSKKLYLCVGAFGETGDVRPDSLEAINKRYRDIESCFGYQEAEQKGLKNPTICGYDYKEDASLPSISSFEKEHIVLNPCNYYSLNSETYNKIRLEYFINLYESQSEDEAIGMLLNKYPRL
jgi:hypothetical protein